MENKYLITELKMYNAMTRQMYITYGGSITSVSNWHHKNMTQTGEIYTGKTNWIGQNVLDCESNAIYRRKARNNYVSRSEEVRLKRAKTISLQ